MQLIILFSPQCHTNSSETGVHCVKIDHAYCMTRTVVTITGMLSELQHTYTYLPVLIIIERCLMFMQTCIEAENLTVKQCLGTEINISHIYLLLLLLLFLFCLFSAFYTSFSNIIMLSVPIANAKNQRCVMYRYQVSQSNQCFQ